MFAHLGGLAGYLVPLTNLLVPLVIYLAKKDESDFVGHHAREALNFQISFTVYALLAGVTVLLLIGFVLLPLLMIAEIVLIVVATLAVRGGQRYRYPLTIRLIR